jgi:hypothetical protein
MFDAGTARLMAIAGGVGGTLLLLVGAYSLRGHHPAGIPVVEADPRPLREKPANPGGMEVFGADDAILGGSSDKTAVAPPPEAPQPAALLAQEQAQAQAEAQAQARAVAAAPSQPAAAAQTAVGSTKPAPLPEPAPAVAAAPRQAAPPAAAAAPEPRPLAERPAALAKADAPPSDKGALQVQLAALETEDGAMSEWRRLSHKLPDLLGTRHPAVSRVERDGKTWFRLRTGGFADVADATAFCHRVREKGNGCTLASF